MGVLGNLSIMGESAMDGGTYKKVSVMGTLSLSDKIEAHEISVMGSMTSNSDVACDKIDVMGSATLRQLTVQGAASVMGQISAKGITAEEFDVKGEAVCDDNFECGELEVRGAVHVGKLLSAERLWIKSKHPSRAKEVGGKRLTVRNPSVFGRPVLRADTIEFDEIVMDCVEAQVVRGRNMIVGKNCKIDLVEYSGDLTQHPSAQVGRAVKI